MGRLWRRLNSPLRQGNQPANACCKCSYDLTTIAEPPPAPSEPDLRCPECGKPVALRDHWWTDGRYPMPGLIAASWLIALFAATLVFVVARDNGPLHPSHPMQPMHPLAFAIASLPMLTLLLIGPVVMYSLAMRGTARPEHLNKRGMAAYVPFAIVFGVYMLVGGTIFEWLGS